MYHLKEFSLARRHNNFENIEYLNPVTVSSVTNNSYCDSVNYLISIDFSNIRKTIAQAMTNIDLRVSIMDSLLYAIYCALNFLRGPFSKVAQSTALLIFIAFKIKKIKFVESVTNTKIVEASRFQYLTAENFKNTYYLPASLKVLITSPKILLQKKAIVPCFKKNTHYKRTKITHRTILTTAIVLSKKFKLLSLLYLPLFIIRAYCIRCIDNVFLNINLSTCTFETIATVEPWQKLLATHVINSNGNVELLQHGVIYDAIGESQLFTISRARGDYKIQVKLDIRQLKLFRILYNVEGQDCLFSPKNPENFDIGNFPKYEKFPTIKRGSEILIYSSFYDEGMAFQTPFSLIFLIKNILRNCDANASFNLRLHPGDSKIAIKYLMRVCGINVQRFDFNDDSNKQYDFSFGLPSTYYLEACKRTRIGSYLYGPVSKYQKNFNSSWVF